MSVTLRNINLRAAEFVLELPASKRTAWHLHHILSKLPEDIVMKHSVIKATLVAATLVLAAGCASNSDLEAVRAEAQAAQQSADQAKAAAAAAQATADQALQSANEANSKIDRAFKKSMYK